MANKLVIVESPAKAKTIGKFLGRGYKVEASQGHVRDLPKSQIGVDVDNNFEPEYITIRGRGEILSKIRKEAKAASKIYLATDPDREGEAISWHLANVLGIDEDSPCRIEFHEVTSKAVKAAVKNPRKIDMDLVNAQQARRVLDRLVGYKISPILWQKVKKGLSAGRVQSVATKIICDREAEIEAFIPEEYWTLDGTFSVNNAPVKARFMGIGDEKVELRTRAEADMSDMLAYYTLWAHQIKTPIAAMRLQLQGEDSAKARALLGDLGRIERYVEMVLTYLRLEGDGTDYVIREYDLDGILRPVFRQFAGEFIGRRLRLDYAPVNHRVLTDEKWLAFVVGQVLSNALKYTPEGAISVYLEPPAVLCVRDTGIGIAPEDLPRVFEQSYTGLTGRADRRASGLGLYLCKRVCDNLRHGISIESAPGAGTTVRIDFGRRELPID